MNIECDNYIKLVNKINCKSLSDVKKILKYKLEEFNKVGCKVIDVAVSSVPRIGSSTVANAAFRKRMQGQKLTPKEIEDFKGYMLFYLLKIAAKNDDVSKNGVSAIKLYNCKIEKKNGKAVITAMLFMNMSRFVLKGFL